MKKTSNFIFLFIFFLLFTLTLLFFVKNSYALSKSKIVKFVNFLKEANSKEDVVKAYKNAGIELRDLKALSRELKNSGTYEKLVSLIGAPHQTGKIPYSKEKLKTKLKLLKSFLTKSQSARKKDNERKLSRMLNKIRKNYSEKNLLPASETQPKIQDLSNNIISPGDSIILRGENFLNERGLLTFHFDGKTINGIIDEWHNSYIIAHIDENLSGLKQSRGYVQVKNRWGKSTEKQIEFYPIEEILTLEDRAYTQSFFSRDLDPVLRNLYCIAQGGAYNLIEKTTTVHNTKLLNGWKVVDYTLGTHIFPEVKYIIPPKIGSSHPQSSISVKEYCLLCLRPPYYVKSFVFIKGPRGVRAF